MKIFTTVFVFLLISFAAFSIQTVYANVHEIGIVGLSGCSGIDCSACNLVYMANGGIKWIIGFLFVVFAGIMVWAGVGLVVSQGNQSALESAKSKFTNAIIGFIIILSAWLIVDTLMRGLLGNGGRIDDGNGGDVSGWLFWSQVQCQVQTEPGFVFLPHASDDASLIPGASNTPGNPYVGGGVNCPVPPASEMVTIPGTGFRASPATAANFVRMRDAASRAGITLNITSAYRSEADQIGIWQRHNCDTINCSGTVARPCTLGGNGSNHNSGQAVDISGSVRGSTIFNWLKDNGGEYGFRNNLGADDPFHWSPSGR